MLDVEIFVKTLLGGFFLAFIQVPLAWRDGYFNRAQLTQRGLTKAYSLTEHGGWRADIFLLCPLIAWMASKYQLAYKSWWSAIIAGMAIAATAIVGYSYQVKGEKVLPDVMWPDSYVHNQATSPAGWVHLVLFAGAIYFFGMFYLTPIHPTPSTSELIEVSVIISGILYLGIRKFTPLWVFSDFAQSQLVRLFIGLWVMTAIRIFWSR